MYNTWLTSGARSADPRTNTESETDICDYIHIDSHAHTHTLTHAHTLTRTRTHTCSDTDARTNTVNVITCGVTPNSKFQRIAATDNSEHNQEPTCCMHCSLIQVEPLV